jgi:hypothetical protein
MQTSLLRRSVKAIKAETVSEPFDCNAILVTLDGLWVACLSFDPRFAGSKPAEENGGLKAIKSEELPSFGGKESRRPHVVKFTAC